MAFQPEGAELIPAPITGQNHGYPSQLAMAWQRRSLTLLGVAIGVVLGALYYSRTPPTYQSMAQVYVIKKKPEALTSSGVGGIQGLYEDYLFAHVTLIKSPLNIQRAVKKPEVQALPSLAGMKDPTDFIIGSLTVTRDKDGIGNLSNILNLTFKGSEAEDCSVILNAVIKSYQEFLDETYKTGSASTVELITNAKEILHKDLAKKEADWKEFRSKSPLVEWKGKDGLNLHQERLGSIESRRLSLMVRKAEVEGRLADMESALKEGQKGVALVAMFSDQAGKNVGPDGVRKQSSLSLEDQLYPLLVQEQTLLQDYGMNHPQVKSVRKRIEFTRKLFASPANLNAKGQEKAEKGEADFSEIVESYAKSLRQELNDINAKEKSLATLFENEHSQARTLSDYELQNDMFRRDVARLEQLYDGIIKRLNEVDLIKDFGGYTAQTIAPARPGVKIGPKAVMVFSMSTFLGLLGGVGLACLAFITDKSFRSPDEIRSRLGSQVLGHIPFAEKDHEAMEAGAATGNEPFHRMLWAHYQTRSGPAEAIRGVRTALYFSTHGEGHKVVQVTSPNKGDGKTTLVSNLAVSIAQSGKKVIIIDADFRRPRLHRIFGISHKIGLASVIAGQAELPEAIRESGISNLSILPCGPHPANPAELLTLPRFKELIDVIREQYDFVLVDTPPLLAVTDPCVVAPRVDGVLLTIRVSKNGRPGVERSKEILDTLGANVLGIVVNGAGATGNYGYKYYRYENKYYYGYNEGYYEDVPAEDTPADKLLVRVENGHDEDALGDVAGPEAEPVAFANRMESERHRRHKGKPGLLKRMFTWR